jgi:thiol-disulfide isomerase/thioredoxin
MTGRIGRWRARLAGLAVGLVLTAGAAGFPAPVQAQRQAQAEPPLSGDMSVFEPADTPEPAPDLNVSDAAGNSVSLEDFAGRTILVNFWATWCAPCVRELPSLDRLQAARGGEDFQVVAVSLDRAGLEAVRPFFDRLNIAHLEVYLDPMGRMARAFEVGAFPTTVLIDEEGRELGRLAGPAEWDEPAAVRLVEYYLSE